MHLIKSCIYRYRFALLSCFFTVYKRIMTKGSYFWRIQYHTQLHDSRSVKQHYHCCHLTCSCIHHVSTNCGKLCCWGGLQWLNVYQIIKENYRFQMLKIILCIKESEDLYLFKVVCEFSPLINFHVHLAVTDTSMVFSDCISSRLVSRVAQ